MADLLELRYIPISQAELFGNNAKLHNLDQIITSITKYGFKSATKWESALNDGRGGIVAGNGRVEALRVMKERGDDCPIGIALSNAGEWCVPVLFGVESSSEVVARAYAFDDNNLTLLGGKAIGKAKIPKYTESPEALKITIATLKAEIGKYAKLQDDVTKLWAKRGITWE